MHTGPAYVTYFDQRYLARAIVMLRSLRRQDPYALVFALCLDDLTHAAIAALNDTHIVPITHADVLAFEPRLRGCASRSRHAYYGTHKPALPLYVLTRWPEISRVTHIDADAWFFGPPAPLFAEIGEASIALSPHRYPTINTAWANWFGAYNAGFISWRNDETGRACLTDYLEDCLDRVEPVQTDGKFMNQGYLTAWPQRYPGVHVLRHPGANLAPWNIATHHLKVRHIDGVARVLVNDAPLIFFHFSRMFRDAHGAWRTDYLKFGEANLAVALVHVYAPYFRAVEAEMKALADAGVETLAVELPAGIDDFHVLT